MENSRRFSSSLKQVTDRWGRWVSETGTGAALGERRWNMSVARPTDWLRSALGKIGRGSRGKSNGPIGWGWGSSEKAGGEEQRRGFIGLGEEGGSRGYFRRGSGLGASTGYGEAFASVNLTGEQRGWALHGEL